MERLLREMEGGKPDALEHRLGGIAVLAVDDVHQLVGRPFIGARIGLLERLRARCVQLVVGVVELPRVALARWLPRGARVVQLALPDAMTRLAIVRAHAVRAGIALPRDVARFLAERLVDNVRQLEGALLRLGAWAVVSGRPISMHTAEEALEPILPRFVRAMDRVPAPAPEPPPPAPVVRRRPRARRRRRAGAGDPAQLRAGIEELIAFAREVGGGRIGDPDVRGQDVYVRLQARDDETYVLRLRVSTYLAAPLRCTFVDDRHRPTRAAWPYPEESGPFRSPDFICMPPVAEFYACHPERTYRRSDGSFTATVAAVFTALHAPEYAGRFTPARQRECDAW
jgi:hypothetical protein